jgi:Tfp pilus assembly protein PilF
LRTAAFDDCSKAINLNANDAEAYCIRAHAYSSVGLFDHALITQSDGEAPNRQPIYLEQYRQAVDDCNKAISLNPNDAISYYTRAGAYKILGEYQKATDDCSQAISLDPKRYDLYVLIISIVHRGSYLPD